MAETRPHNQLTWREYLACYTLYIVLIATGIGVLYWVVRQAILALLAALLGQSFANRIIYLGSMTLLGLGLFILVMAAEPYLRNGAARRQLLRRFIRLSVPIIVAAVLGLLVLATIG
jgi:hypothetical protein